MKLNAYLDVLIPRGGAGLIANTVKMQRYQYWKRAPETVMSMSIRMQILPR